MLSARTFQFQVQRAPIGHRILFIIYFTEIRYSMWSMILMIMVRNEFRCMIIMEN